MSNAIDSIHDKGEIEIKTSLINNNTNLLISIKDTGEGIPDDVKLKIFDPFFTTKEVGKGVGLGLSISYSIIKEHKGELYFESEHKKGTIFNISLPLLQK